MSVQHNPFRPGSDLFYLRESLRLAERGLGWTSGNPNVGCVLVRDGQIVGEGWHARLGALHAEAAAIEDAKRRSPLGASGTVCYASLEPCSHSGLQPPCCDLLAAAGVAGVVYGCQDADPRSAGRSESVLAASGIPARMGPAESGCEEYLDEYLFPKRSHRAFTHLKLALSLDARMACANGASQWLSGPQSHGLAHYLRQKYDAVLVGAGTVLADNPRLTVRPETLAQYFDPKLIRLRDPARVVLDPQFRLLPRLLAPDSEFSLAHPSENLRPDRPWLVVAGLSQSLPAGTALPPGVELLGLSGSESARLDFAELKARLYELELHSLLVEGGASVARAMLSQRAADKLTLVYTAILIGADGLDFSPALGSESLGACPHLTGVRIEVLGQDAAYTGYPDWPTDISRLKE